MSGPYPNDQSNPAGATPVWIAAIAGRGTITPIPPTPAPATLAASGGGATWASGAIPCGGIPALAVSAELDHTGTLSLQRYIDVAGTVPIGAAITQAMTANAIATIWVRDGLPAASFQVTVVNTGGVLANLTNVNILESM